MPAGAFGLAPVLIVRRTVGLLVLSVALVMVARAYSVIVFANGLDM